MELKCGKMGPSTMVNGHVIRLMVMVHFVMQMVMSMKVNGRMIKPMVSEFTSILMALNSKDHGLKINKRDKVLKPGLMEPNMKGPIKLDKKMVFL